MENSVILSVGQRWIDNRWQGDWESTQRFLEKKAGEYGLSSFYPSKFVVEIEIIAKSKYGDNKWVANRKFADGSIMNNIIINGSEIKKKEFHLWEPPQPEKSRLAMVIDDY